MGGPRPGKWTTTELLDDVWRRMSRPDLRGFDAAVVRRGVLPAVANRPKASVIGDAVDGGPRAELPSPTREVEPEVAVAVRDHLLRGDGPVVLGLVLRTADAVVEEILSRLRDGGLATRSAATRALRGKVVRRVARVFDADGEPPSGARREEIVRDLASAVAADLRLQALQVSDATFARWGTTWDRAWELRGQTAAARVPPSSVGSGELDRPPFVGEPRGNSQDGTDRSVLSRYKLVFRSNAHDHEQAAGPADLHVTRRFLHAGPELVLHTVIDRACATLGLSRPGHRMVIRSVAAAMAESPPARPSTGLEDWAVGGPEPATVPDDEPEDALVAAVRHHVAMRLRSPVEDTGRQRPIDRLRPDELRAAVVRRLWHHLAQQEAEWEITAARTEIVRLVVGAFSRSLCDAEQRVRPEVREVEGLEAGEVVAEQKRTLDAIGALPVEEGREFVHLYLTDRPAWRRRYIEIVRDVPGCLSVTDAEEFFGRLLGEGDDG